MRCPARRGGHEVAGIHRLSRSDGGFLAARRTRTAAGDAADRLLDGGSPDMDAKRVGAFRQNLSEAGYVEGRNVAIECRWAEGHYERFPALATDLVRRQVAVIANDGGCVTDGSRNRTGPTHKAGAAAPVAS
jgi:hypothetical protein